MDNYIKLIFTFVFPPLLLAYIALYMDLFENLGWTILIGTVEIILGEIILSKTSYKKKIFTGILYAIVMLILFFIIFIKTTPNVGIL